ncbi:phosphate acyltransferase PlsX [Candidatus Palauibacter sp.]|uniref:phosphate acyltransferase PlsX n=1 Tax=Candidatus Palauibacter sp. TaxID=3101350 RepID=UPI003B01DA05
MIRVALDLMGGDAAPEATLDAAEGALDAWPDDLSLLLVGPRSLLRGERTRFPRDRVAWLPAEESIDPAEPPALAVRRKADSTVVRGLGAVRDGTADGFVSAGPTGATVVASVLTLGLLPGVDRPPVGALFPTATGRVLVMDVGANVDVTPRQLHQFAHLGSTYLRRTLSIERPRIGLLNIGAEGEKGGDVMATAHGLLSADTELDFIGNVEGHLIVTGACDVLVCGGFVGNVLLKFYESIAEFVLEIFRNAGVGEGGRLGEALRFLDYAEYGGAPLFGVDGVTVICHGTSPARAIMNGIRTAADCAASGFTSVTRTSLARMPQESGA